MSEQKKVLHSLIEELPEELSYKIIDYILYIKYTVENKDNETAILSEKSLAKEWLTKEEDEAWASL